MRFARRCPGFVPVIGCVSLAQPRSRLPDFAFPGSARRAAVPASLCANGLGSPKQNANGGGGSGRWAAPAVAALLGAPGARLALLSRCFGARARPGWSVSRAVFRPSVARELARTIRSGDASLRCSSTPARTPIVTSCDAAPDVGRFCPHSSQLDWMLLVGHCRKRRFCSRSTGRAARSDPAAGDRAVGSIVERGKLARASAQFSASKIRSAPTSSSEERVLSTLQRGVNSYSTLSSSPASSPKPRS